MMKATTTWDLIRHDIEAERQVNANDNERDSILFSFLQLNYDLSHTIKPYASYIVEESIQNS